LNDAQIAALRKIYAGVRNPRTGELVAPGIEPGGEAEQQPDGFTLWISGPVPSRSGDFLLSSNFFRYMMFADPTYDMLARLNFDADVAATDAKLADILGGFKRRGGKLIHWHGWSDAVIPPRFSVAYHDRVQGKMGDASTFYRLFMVPGMCHCEGGRGPNVLPTLSAIAAWVENGKPPDRLTATKFVDDDRSKPVERTRPLCPYPQLSQWDGKGDRSRAGSYRCVSGGARAGGPSEPRSDRRP
jgi:feruloyl esterase